MRNKARRRAWRRSMKGYPKARRRQLMRSYRSGLNLKRQVRLGR